MHACLFLWTKESKIEFMFEWLNEISTLRTLDQNLQNWSEALRFASSLTGLTGHGWSVDTKSHRSLSPTGLGMHQVPRQQPSEGLKVDKAIVQHSNQIAAASLILFSPTQINHLSWNSGLSSYSVTKAHLREQIPALMLIPILQFKEDRGWFWVLLMKNTLNTSQVSEVLSDLRSCFLQYLLTLRYPWLGCSPWQG